jgi:hypothetical protein
LKTRSIILREIYAELKNSVPDGSMSPRELLVAANQLLNLYLKTETEEVGDFDQGFDDIVDENDPYVLPVDAVLASDKWLIYSDVDFDLNSFLENYDDWDPELMDRIHTIIQSGD